MKPLPTIRVLDSHTEGEPTRVIVSGGPTFRGTSMLDVRRELESEHDWLRTSCLNEPRGNEAMVGAILCESTRDDCVAGVVFFNNVGYLNGCIHGTIGVVQTLIHLETISAGDHGIETPVGRVTAIVDQAGIISVRNVASFRHLQGIELKVAGFGTVVGDVAWGGNWFFLTDNPTDIPLERARTAQLTQFAMAIRQSLRDNAVTGRDGGEIDHIEIFAKPTNPQHADSKNFVLCPGNAYDRSPCGTGTSAKLACLVAAGKLSPGQVWRQAGILDTIFYGSAAVLSDGSVIPTIQARAFINAEANLLIDPADPFRFGIPSPISLTPSTSS